MRELVPLKAAVPGLRCRGIFLVHFSIDRKRARNAEPPDEAEVALPPERRGRLTLRLDSRRKTTPRLRTFAHLSLVSFTSRMIRDNLEDSSISTDETQRRYLRARYPSFALQPIDSSTGVVL